MRIRPAVLVFNLVLLALRAAALGQSESNATAWQIAGRWHVNRASDIVQPGDQLPASALLTADASSESSVVILMTDGQRLFFDCHDAASCSQGFRLPAVTARPENEATEIFRRVCRVRRQEAAFFPVRMSPSTARVEAVRPLQQDDSIDLTQALQSLPPGTYRVTAQMDGANSELFTQELHHSGAADPVVIKLPRPGLCAVSFYGSLKVERMRVYVLVVTPSIFSTREREFQRAGTAIQGWSERAAGWPTHDLLVAYLKYLSGLSSSQ